VFFFYFFKTYDGIIRLSEIREVITAIGAVFCSFCIILLLNIIFSLAHWQTFIPNSALFVHFFITSFIISGYRILVKNTYKISYAEKGHTHVIVYGAESNGSFLQKQLTALPPVAIR